MNTRERTKITIDDTEDEKLDLSGFEPDLGPEATQISADKVKEVSEKSGFRSREPKQTPLGKRSRRKRSPYTAQLGARVKPETKERFQDKAISLEMTDAEALNEALTLWLKQR